MDFIILAALLVAYLLDAIDALVCAERQRLRYGGRLRPWFSYYLTSVGREDRRTRKQ